MLRNSLSGLMSLLLLGGCAHPVAHRYYVDPSIPDDVQMINARAKGRDLRLEFTTGEQVSAQGLAVGLDSTSFLEQEIWRPSRGEFRRGHLRIAPTDSIGEIRVFMRKETTLVTTCGLATTGGLATLVLIRGFLNALSEDGKVGYDIRFAIPGVVGGALYGFLLGEANAEWDAYTLSRGGGRIAP